MANHSHSAHGEAHASHIVPFSVYLTVLLVLFTLTIITVVAAHIDFGNWNIVIAMLIASVKAGTVGLFFMHLKYENPLIWLYVLFPIVLVGIMLGGILSDNPNRTDPKIYLDKPAPEAHAAAAAEHH